MVRRVGLRATSWWNTSTFHSALINFHKTRTNKYAFDWQWQFRRQLFYLILCLKRSNAKVIVLNFSPTKSSLMNIHILFTSSRVLHCQWICKLQFWIGELQNVYKYVLCKYFFADVCTVTFLIYWKCILEGNHDNILFLLDFRTCISSRT